MAVIINAVTEEIVEMTVRRGGRACSKSNKPRQKVKAAKAFHHIAVNDLSCPVGILKDGLVIAVFFLYNQIQGLTSC